MRRRWFFNLTMLIALGLCVHGAVGFVRTPLRGSTYDAFVEYARTLSAGPHPRYVFHGAPPYWMATGAIGILLGAGAWAAKRRWLGGYIAALTMCMAVVVVVLWVRSIWVSDQLTIGKTAWEDGLGHSGNRHLTMATQGGVLMIHWGHRSRPIRPPYRRDPKEIFRKHTPDTFVNYRVEPHMTKYPFTYRAHAHETGPSIWNKYGFGFGRQSSYEEFQRRRRQGVAGQYEIAVYVPLWAAVMACVAYPMLYLAMRLRRTIRSRRGRCSVCGYDLRCSPGRCPECGASELGVAYRIRGRQPAADLPGLWADVCPTFGRSDSSAGDPHSGQSWDEAWKSRPQKAHGTCFEGLRDLRFVRASQSGSAKRKRNSQWGIHRCHSGLPGLE